MGVSATGAATELCRVAVICPYALARAGLCHLLDANRYRVVWHGADASGLLASLSASSPDLILAGWGAPGVDIPLIEKLTAPPSTTTVVILASPNRCKGLSDAMVAGAAGCLSCDQEPTQFATALKMLVQGNVVISHDLAASAIGADGGGLESKLTPRELQVLEALGRGATNSEIAEELFLSPHTVKIHVHEVLTRMGFRNRQQAAIYVASRGDGRPGRLDV